MRLILYPARLKELQFVIDLKPNIGPLRHDREYSANETLRDKVII